MKTRVILSKRRQDGFTLFEAFISLVIIGITVGAISYHYAHKWMDPLVRDPAAEQVAQEYNGAGLPVIEMPDGDLVFLPGTYGSFSLLWLELQDIPYDNISSPIGSVTQAAGAPMDATDSATNLDHATIETYITNGLIHCEPVYNTAVTPETLSDLGCQMDPTIGMPVALEQGGSGWGQPQSDSNVVTITIFKADNPQFVNQTNLATFSAYWDQTNVYYDYDWARTNPSAFYRAMYAFPQAFPAQ